MQTNSMTMTAGSCRFAACLLNYGNIAMALIPPLALLWLAASMVVYAMNRHHPEERVGEYTQRAAYRVYGVTGLVVAVAMFIPLGAWDYYLALWALAVLFIVPLSIKDLLKIRRENWCDLTIEETENNYD